MRNWIECNEGIVFCFIIIIFLLILGVASKHRDEKLNESFITACYARNGFVIYNIDRGPSCVEQK